MSNQSNRFFTHETLEKNIGLLIIATDFCQLRKINRRQFRLNLPPPQPYWLENPLPEK